jgi:SAM-dependent methyltransferase
VESAPPYSSILNWYQERLREHGDSHLGVGWPDQGKVEVMYQVMLSITEPNVPATLLDFGCGPARMLDWMMTRNRWPHLQYTGLDFNPDSVTFARQKYPAVRFITQDILREPLNEQFDYVVMNGILTMKAQMSFEAMWDYAQELLRRVFVMARRGLAFNVMSKAVDWEKDILFHLPTDLLIGFVTKHLTRRFVIRQDYAPFEYTVYLYRQAYTSRD